MPVCKEWDFQKLSRNAYISSSNHNSQGISLTRPHSRGRQVVQVSYHWEIKEKYNWKVIFALPEKKKKKFFNGKTTMLHVTASTSFLRPCWLRQLHVATNILFYINKRIRRKAHAGRQSL